MDNKPVTSEYSTDTASETHVNWVVEVRRGQRAWLCMSNAGDSEADARMAYDSWLTGKARTEGTFEVRLVRRVSVVTSEVIEHG